VNAGIAAVAHLRVVAVAALATGGIVEVKADSQGTARLSRSSFSSTGLGGDGYPYERPRGKAILGVRECLSFGGGIEPLSGACKATKALLIDSATISWMAARCAELSVL